MTIRLFVLSILLSNVVWIVEYLRKRFEGLVSFLYMRVLLNARGDERLKFVLIYPVLLFSAFRERMLIFLRTAFMKVPRLALVIAEPGV